MALINLPQGYVPGGDAKAVNAIGGQLGPLYNPVKPRTVQDAVTQGDTGPTDLGGTGGGGGGTVSNNSAYWNTQLSALNDQLGRLDTQAGIGQGNIDRGYNSAFNTLTTQKTQNQEDYNTNRNQTIQDNVGAKNNIDQGVHNQISSLSRLLGAHGAGNSSAAQIAAPYAAGVQGNQQRQQVQDAYGRNISSLDTNWDRTLKGFDSAFGQLTADKQNKQNALQSGIANTRQNLLGQQQQVRASMGLAPDPSIQQRIKDLGGQIDQFGAQQVFDPGKVDYKTPDLAKYNVNPLSAPSLGAGVDPSQASNVGPYYTLLGDQKKDKTAVGA